MPNSSLEVTSLTKKVGKKVLVEDVSFSVEKGEIFGLLGPNGAGKTTIIRMIVNLINRSGGCVKIDGHDLDNSFKLAMNEVGAIVETPEFYSYMSGRKNLKLYAKMALKKISTERIEEVIKLAGLEDAIDQKVKTYSLGMRQRLGVAQALLHSPAVLILDEPTNGLDPQGIKEFRENLHSLAEKGISVLISSHLLSEMQLMCNRFAIIEKGRLTHISSMEDSIQGSGQNETPVVFKLSNIDKALAILEDSQLVSNIKGEKSSSHVSCSVKKENISKVNSLLVANDIEVFGFDIIQPSLEERFLELTNGQQKQTS
jgi:ABC-2 type transport system ATP-binding protein